jgi:hypothetical protein
MIEAALVETLIKHLPPSASTLRLLDVVGNLGAALAARRADLAVTVGTVAGENSVDAGVAYAAVLNDELLALLLFALRPGGRLIVIDPRGEASGEHVKRLEVAGYTRILVEELLPTGVLMRGEKPHVTDDTLARVQGVAALDKSEPEFRGRYVHLLIRQTPNKPVWALKPGETVTWQAVALVDADTPRLLAFSSLPNAVAFMQPAVVAGSIRDVNKVAKFSRATTQNWTLLLNPPLDVLQGREIVLVPIDPASAETPDE